MKSQKRHGDGSSAGERVIIMGAAGRDFHTFNVCFRDNPEDEALPAMGYSKAQLEDLASTIAAVLCDTVVVATLVDLARLISLPKPYCRVRYDFEEISHPDLGDVVSTFVRKESDRLKHS